MRIFFSAGVYLLHGPIRLIGLARRKVVDGPALGTLPRGVLQPSQHRQGRPGRQDTPAVIAANVPSGDIIALKEKRAAPDKLHHATRRGNIRCKNEKSNSLRHD